MVLVVMSVESSSAPAHMSGEVILLCVLVDHYHGVETGHEAEEQEMVGQSEQGKLNLAKNNSS